MNAAYKWYSHNNNIIQFYSDHSCSRVYKPMIDSVKETVERTCNYALNIVESCNDININY